jgi:hypothetical protein
MKTKIKISKLLQIGLLLTFFLPFFPQGCKPKQAEEVPMTDSTIVSVDTLRQESIALTQQDQQSDTAKTAIYKNSTQNINKTEVEEEGNGLSTKISKKSKILKLLLRPNGNYTGISSLIDFFSALKIGYGLGIAFILWIIALIIKLKDFNNIFILINIIGLIFLSVSHSLNVFNDTRLWGFWVCLIWSTTMIIYDCFILLKIRKARQKTCA